jgi:type II secretion system protein J
MNLTTACRKRERDQGAFTLLEVLIATALFAIILASIQTVFYSTVRLRNRTIESVEQAAPIQQALAVLKQDLINLVPTGGTFFGPLQTTPSNNGSGTNVMSLIGLNGQQVSPVFFTSGGAIDTTSTWGEVQQVTYTLADPTNKMRNGKDLIRYVGRNMLPVMSDQPEPHYLLGGVQNVTFQYYNGTAWVDTWDSTTSSNVPAAIKLQIQLAAKPLARIQSAPIELVVPIWVATTNQSN